MLKQIHISIPEPCHEKWSEMTPTEQGAFCKACNKQVIDFSRKTQNEIYHLLMNEQGNKCGRFTKEQLDNPIVKSEINTSWFNWRAIAASLAALVTAEKAKASDKNVTPFASVQILQVDTITAIANKQDTVAEVVSKTTIEGVVVDAETREPLIGANILIKGTYTGTVTDFDGRFKLEVNLEGDAVTQFSYIGYKPLEMPVSKLYGKQTIEMVEMEQALQGLIVVGAYTRKIDDPFNVNERNELQERYDPRLDIRKKVRDRAKGKVK